MGRVYDVFANDRGRVYDAAGAKMTLVTRVEFDGDGPKGMAVVTRYAADAAGLVLRGPGSDRPACEVVRAWVRWEPKPPAGWPADVDVDVDVPFVVGAA